MRFLSKPNPLALSVAAAVVMTSAGSTAVYAQQRQLEEIVVTAERRAVSEQTTSISMEVFTGEDLSAQQIQQIEDLQNEMPGIQIQQNGLGNDVNIRGVGNSVFSPDVQMGVQVINDGFTQGEPMGLNGAFFDVGTVEVLRGPQGTFVGQSAAGGAILINSADPNFDGVNGYIEGTIGNYHRNQVQGAMNLPISDTVAARLAFNTHRRESFYRNEGSLVNQHGGGIWHPGEVDDRQIRLSVLWQPNQQFEATFKVENNNVDHSGDFRQPKLKATSGVADHDDDPATPPIQVTTYSQYRQYTPPDPYTIHYDWNSRDSQTNEQWTLQMSYEFANGNTLTSRTGYNRLHVMEVSDDDRSSVPTVPDRYELGPDNRSWSQEFTLASPEAPTNWIVGAFAQTRTTPFRIYGPGGQPNDQCGWQADGTHVECGPLVPPTSFSYFQGTAFVDNYAIFGQYNYALTNELELAIGARWNVDSSSRTNRLVVSGPVGTSHPAFGGPYQANTCEQYGIYGGRFSNINTQYDPSGWGCIRAFKTTSDIDNLPVDTEVPTYKIGLNWQPTDNSYYYAFYARGYKAGTQQGDGVQPELIDDYELGWKGSLFDGRLSGDIGVYYMDYQDMQGSAFVANDPIGSDTVNTNFGAASMLGIEGSFQAFIGNLGLRGSIAIQDSEIENVRTLNDDLLPGYVEFDSGDFDYLPQCDLPGGPTSANAATGFLPDGATPNGTCFDYEPYFINLSGQEQMTSPPLSYNLSLDYQFLLPRGTVTPRLSFSHTDENYANLIQTDYYLNDERQIWDFNIVYEVDDWTVDMFVQNLTNETYIQSARGNIVGYGDPQTYGIRARMNF